jgi:transcriptional regulator with PAS, ATPase and Fis domain
VHIGKYFQNSPLEEVLRTQSPILDNLEKLQDELFIFNHVPVTMGQKFLGVVSTFKDRSTVVSAESKVRRSLSKGHIAKYTLDNLISRSQLMKHITDQAKQFAKVDSPIMITGETGTGKEILGQSIHNLSGRRRKPFVSINCAAMPEQLLESELFGYEEGAFTGSRKGGKSGLFELAHEGTIFLDEISTTSERFQSQLLRVVQEKEVMRIGGDRLIPLNVRLIAAANKRLSEEVRRGTFRQDLFFRLSVLYIEIPPLRKRVEDIPVLLDHFITTVSKEHQFSPLTLPRGYVERLMEYAWPGNVRQLRNFVERLVLLCGSRFDEEILETVYVELIESMPAQEIPAPTQSATNYTLREQLDLEKRQTARRIIEKALEESRFSRGKACEILGISRTTLWKKMKELGIE